MQSPTPLITTIVQAGAGTGKTESLARRMIEVAKHLYDRDKKVPRLVATTFTERATAELRERVVLNLSKEKDVPQWLSDFVQDTERLHISTIHGTLSHVLHRFGTLLGIDPEFIILSATEERDLLGLVIRDLISKKPELGLVLEEYSFSELLDLLTDLICQYRSHGKAFGPAQGWQGVALKDLANLKEALQEVCRVDMESLSPKLAEKVQVLQKLLPLISQAGDDYITVRPLFMNAVGEMSKPPIKEGGKGSEIKGAIDFIFELKKEKWGDLSYDPLFNTHHNRCANTLVEIVGLASEKLRLEKENLGSLSFDDLEFLTAELIEKHPQVIKAIRQDWDFWFIDEYQDTSPLQKKLLFQFFRNPWNTYFVGDPQQSIYLFRGADENVFQDTKVLVEGHGGKNDRLATNYRSHPDLLRFMNLLFKTMTPPMGELLPKGPEEKEIRAEVHLAASSDESEVSEESLITHQIFKWKALGHAFHDMAVLVRTNNKAKNVARELALSGIPVFIHSSGGYYDRREVLDALALLTIIEDPSDDDAFIMAARSPWMGIDDETLAQWGVARERLGFWDYLTSNPLEMTKYQGLVYLAHAVENAESLPLSIVFQELISQLGLFEFCLVEDMSGRREANLRKLVSRLRSEESKPLFSATHFIESAWTELEGESEESEAASFIEPQRVNIMTIHKSKGLKFNCVVVPHGSEPLRPRSGLLELSPDGRFAVKVLSPESEEKVAPIMHQVLKEERFERERAENQRVFYVAVTRAAERLSLIGRKEITPGSWFANCGLLSHTEIQNGIQNDSFEVTIHTKPPEIGKNEGVKQKEPHAIIKLPQISQKSFNRATVTEVVNEAMGGEKAIGRLPLKAQLESQQRGQALHALFESLKLYPTASLLELVEQIQKRFMTSWKIDLKSVSKTLEIENPPLKKIIAQGETEWPFVIKAANSVLEGQIDLWGDVDGVTWIIDYKSAKNIEEQALKIACRQLELYALALSKTGRAWTNIKTAVITPLEGKAYVLDLREEKEVIADLLAGLHRRQDQNVKPNRWPQTTTSLD